MLEEGESAEIKPPVNERVGHIRECRGQQCKSRQPVHALGLCEHALGTPVQERQRGIGLPCTSQKPDYVRPDGIGGNSPARSDICKVCAASRAGGAGIVRCSARVGEMEGHARPAKEVVTRTEVDGLNNKKSESVDR